VLGLTRFALVAAAPGDSLESRRLLPNFLRLMMVRSEKHRRLYGGGDAEKLRDLDQFVARGMADKGVEMTPEECAEVRSKIVRNVRGIAVAKGIRMPAEDLGVIEFLKSLRD
jgi:hypothetical protein